MKILRLLVSSNGWEYSHMVTIRYQKGYILGPKDDPFFIDSEGNQAHYLIIVDGVKITFDEGFELLESK